MLQEEHERIYSPSYLSQSKRQRWKRTKNPNSTKRRRVIVINAKRINARTALLSRTRVTRRKSPGENSGGRGKIENRCIDKNKDSASSRCLCRCCTGPCATRPRSCRRLPSRTTLLSNRLVVVIFKIFKTISFVDNNDSTCFTTGISLG